jgi:hypothetical protein
MARVRKRQRIKYRNGKERCRCGGQVMYESTITERLPIGFGFVSGRFQIDTLKSVGYGGNCMECHAPIFAVKSVRGEAKVPRGINAKIRAARKQ